MDDGTLCTEDEMLRMIACAPFATVIRHMPTGGTHAPLEALKNMSSERRIYTHINNTNPILADGSAEQLAVLSAGIEISYDGMEIEL